MIELDEALEALRKVVARKGEDYVYDGARTANNGCVYHHDGQPQCIVGHVLAELLPEEWLNLATVRVNSGAWYLKCRDSAVTESAARVLSMAQDVQDDGLTWGEAFRRAKKEARRALV